jgi:acyl-CoA thioesterase I
LATLLRKSSTCVSNQWSSIAIVAVACTALAGCSEGSGSIDPGTGGSGGSAASGGSGAGASGGSGGSSGATGSGGSGGAGASGGTGGNVSPIVANPLVSRGKPAFASSGNARLINDGVYRANSWDAGAPTSDAPAWIAIQVGSGFQRLLLSWTASYNYNYARGATETDYGAPLDYTIETSQNSTDGEDGDWQPVATVTANPVRTRAHSFDFDGQSWVRLTITAAPSMSANGIQLDEIDVHDVSNGSEDTWFFLGDSITAFAYDRAREDQPSFAEVVHAKHAGHFPALINGGIGSELTTAGVARIDQALELNPDFRFFAIGYGTNDSWGNQLPVATFKSNLQTIIDRVKAAKRVPVLAHIPFSPDGNHDNVGPYNQAIDELTQTNDLPVGPDLYGWFEAHPDQLQTDKVHPAPAGRVAMNQLWADAMDPLYPE